MARLPIIEAHDVHTPYALTSEDFAALEACLEQPLCVDWRARVQRIVNTYFACLHEVRYFDAKLVIRHYRSVSKGLRELAEKISFGPSDADAKTWAGPNSAVNRIAFQDIPAPRLVEELELAATGFENAAVYAEKVSEPVSSGPKPNEALDTFVMHLAELFHGAGLSPAYSFKQNVHNSGTDAESGGHDTPFICFINTLYELLPEEVQVVDSAAQDGPLATRARRVVRALRKRGQLKA
jgi:hypothetical protein